MLKANFGLESLVIPNGHPAPSRQGVKANPPVVLWVANIKAWKQPKIFIDLAKRLSDTEAKFVMIGKEGDKKFHNKFLEMILRCSEPRVRWAIISRGGQCLACEI